MISLFTSNHIVYEHFDNWNSLYENSTFLNSLLQSVDAQSSLWTSVWKAWSINPEVVAPLHSPSGVPTRRKESWVLNILFWANRHTCENWKFSHAACSPILVDNQISSWRIELRIGSDLCMRTLKSTKQYLLRTFRSIVCCEYGELAEYSGAAVHRDKEIGDTIDSHQLNHAAAIHTYILAVGQRYPILVFCK
jgi:hypothetical protein